VWSLVSMRAAFEVTVEVRCSSFGVELVALGIKGGTEGVFAGVSLD
jgi:hypothetical protein